MSEFLTFRSNILRARAAPPLHLLAGLRQLLLSRENKRGLWSHDLRQCPSDRRASGRLVRRGSSCLFSKEPNND